MIRSMIIKNKYAMQCIKLGENKRIKIDVDKNRCIGDKKRFESK